jgi:hypothetical protein
MATPELSDADVRVLLKDFQVDPEAGGAKDEATRLKLLVLVLGKVQVGGAGVRAMPSAVLLSSMYC